MKKLTIIGALVILTFSLLGSLAYAQNSSGNNNNSIKKEEHSSSVKPVEQAQFRLEINHNGEVLARGGKVESISGNTLTVLTTQDSFSLKWTLETNNSTEFIRLYGGKSSLSEISVGDTISFRGKLSGNATSIPTVIVRQIKDWSIQKKQGTFQGTVSSLGAGTGLFVGSFVLQTKERGNQTIFVSTTTKITIGDKMATLADIKINDKVNVRGLWHETNRTVSADHVRIFVEKIVEEKVLEGTLRLVTVSTSTSGTILIVKKGSGDGNNPEFTVHIAPDTAILNNSWLRISLSVFKPGDKIRVFGAYADGLVEATVVRNTSVR